MESVSNLLAVSTYCSILHRCGPGAWPRGRGADSNRRVPDYEPGLGPNSSHPVLKYHFLTEVLLWAVFRPIERLFYRIYAAGGGRGLNQIMNASS